MARSAGSGTASRRSSEAGSRSGRRIALPKTLLLRRGTDGVLGVVSLGSLRVLVAWRAEAVMPAAPDDDLVLADVSAVCAHVLQAGLDGLLVDRGGPAEVVLSRAEVEDIVAAEGPRPHGTFTPTQLLRTSQPDDARRVSGEQPVTKRR